MERFLEQVEPVSVLVIARGPDPKLAKATASPFFTASSGTTALSASGELRICPNSQLSQFVAFSAVRPHDSSWVAGLLMPVNQAGDQTLLVPALLARSFILASRRPNVAAWKAADLLPFTRYRRCKQPLCLMLTGLAS